MRNLALLFVLLFVSGVVFPATLNEIAVRDLAVAGVNAINPPAPELLNIWSRQYTPGARARTVAEIRGSSNTRETFIELEVSGNPRTFAGTIYLDVDMSIETGIVPLGFRGRPFDLGADYAVHVLGESGWLEGLRETGNLGKVDVVNAIPGRSLLVAIPNDKIGSSGNGNINFALAAAAGSGLEFIPDPAEYEASRWPVKQRSLRLFSTGLLTVSPSSGVLFRRGPLTLFGTLLGRPVDELVVGLETFRYAEVKETKFILDGSDATAGFGIVFDRQGFLPITNDDFRRYGAMTWGRSWGATLPDRLFPGPHTLTVVITTDQGVFVQTVQWFVRTVFEPGDISRLTAAP